MATWVSNALRWSTTIATTKRDHTVSVSCTAKTNTVYVGIIGRDLTSSVIHDVYSVSFAPSGRNTISSRERVFIALRRCIEECATILANAGLSITALSLTRIIARWCAVNSIRVHILLSSAFPTIVNSVATTWFYNRESRQDAHFNYDHTVLAHYYKSQFNGGTILATYAHYGARSYHRANIRDNPYASVFHKGHEWDYARALVGGTAEEMTEDIRRLRTAVHFHDASTASYLYLLVKRAELFYPR